MRAQLDPFVDALPEWPPVIAHEQTAYGWRGLTAEGEVLEVKANNGAVPEEIVVAREGRPVGRRIVRNEPAVDIDEYLLHFNRVVELYKANRIEEAMVEAAVVSPPTLRSKHNRAMVLLAAGKWREGLSEYWECEQSEPFIRPQARAVLRRGMRPWMGEDIAGKKLALIHAHGHGDTIMTLRYVRKLEAMGASVIMVMPQELIKLASQCGRVVDDLIDEDFLFCPMLHLLHFLGVTPDRVSGDSYLRVTNRHPFARSERKRIGLAWSIGKPSDGDYPREIPMWQLVRHFSDCDLHSVQIQNAEEARAFGVKTHEYENFSDCANIMTQMDAIVSVDTAALHLAGAIGHPKVYGLLSHWSSWRWVAPWYDNIKLCRQTSDGDWASALAQVK